MHIKIYQSNYLSYSKIPTKFLHPSHALLIAFWHNPSMSGQILIDPMIPHYQRVVRAISQKGGKATRLAASLMNPKQTLKQEEQYPQEAIELQALNQANDRINSDQMSDYLKDAEKEGIQQAMRETVRENRRNTFKFYGLINKSEKIVHKIKNIVPLLPGEIIIDTSKITFIHRPFFFSERIHAISVKDITDVYVETAPFFGTLNVVDANFAENVVKLNWFRKRDAEKARRIITGLMAVSKENVDLKNVEEDDLDDKLEEIGKIRETKTSVSKA